MIFVQITQKIKGGFVLFVEYEPCSPQDKVLYYQRTPQYKRDTFSKAAGESRLFYFVFKKVQGKTFTVPEKNRYNV